ncbi:unnamed protein product [Protopolystoma xenopodis]|uniref:Uncharacterized protein n=1 Tax=Protopolystoma xenopodis TaxID=117903 RepID=A0A3S5ASH5_9PLAT|nr:unnamed protein product [Protopolystoma xenopodis]
MYKPESWLPTEEKMQRNGGGRGLDCQEGKRHSAGPTNVAHGNAFVSQSSGTLRPRKSVSRQASTAAGQPALTKFCQSGHQSLEVKEGSAVIVEIMHEPSKTETAITATFVSTQTDAKDEKTHGVSGIESNCLSPQELDRTELVTKGEHKLACITTLSVLSYFIC